jgi:DNA-binding MarR family transcriptional regulator
MQTARRLVDLFDADTQRTQKIGRTAPNALRVLAALRQRPVLGLSQLCQRTGMTFPTGSKAMDKLACSGIVRELTGKRRNRVFVYGAYLDIISEGGEPL